MVYTSQKLQDPKTTDITYKINPKLYTSQKLQDPKTPARYSIRTGELYTSQKLQDPKIVDEKCKFKRKLDDP